MNEKSWISLLGIISCETLFDGQKNKKKNSQIQRKFKKIGEKWRYYQII
jgi:hypothetical protein